MAPGSPIVACPPCGRNNRVAKPTYGRARRAQCQGDLPWIVDAQPDHVRRQRINLLPANLETKLT